MKEIKYVVTNPPRHMKLKADDLVFVLALSDPSMSDQTDDSRFYNKKMRKNSNNNRPKTRKNGSESHAKQAAEKVDGEEQPKLDALVGQRQAKEDFEKLFDKLTDKITRVKKDAISLQKQINKRDSTIVPDLTKSIEEIIHQVSMVGFPEAE